MADYDIDRLDELFNRALELQEGERASFLKRECGDDRDLRARLERMLASADRARAYFGDLEGEIRAVAPAELKGESEGTRVGPYRILGEIGRGGMGRVYLAERDDGQFEQRVALKILRRGADSTLARERFLAERRIVSRLEHPHVARLFDGGITDRGFPYAVMEYVEGADLTEYCTHEDLGLRERLELFLQVASAVEYAHRNLVVHRDLKPSNVRVDERGDAKLLDFGIAKLLTESPEGSPRTRTGVRMLTPQYAAPEQIREGPASTTVDVYGLGAILYELISGRRAFEVGAGSSQHEIERRILEEDPELPSVAAREGAPMLAHRLRGDLDAICMKALRKEPDQRYSSVAAMATDVRAFLAGRPVKARQGSSWYRARKFARRHRLGLAAAAGVTVVLVIAGALFARQSIRTARERDRADRVTELFVELFEVADPSTSRGAEVTAREVLDAGVDKVSGRLESQPAVAASLLEVMGRVYHNLGLYDRALELLERSVDLRRNHGAAGVELVGPLERLGRLLRDRGEYVRSEAVLRQALNLAERELGARDPSAAAVRNSLGRTLYSLGEFAEARVLFETSLETFEALATGWVPERADSLAGLGRVLYGQGDYAGAEPYFERALELRSQALGAEHITVGETLNHLGSARSRLGDAEAARAAYDQALAIRRKLLGSEHPAVADTLNGLGMAHRDLGDRETAERLLREALAIRRRVLDPDHPSLAQALSNLGLLLQERGDLDEANDVYAEALAIRRQALGESHVLVAHSYNNIGMLAQLRGRLDEAEEYLRRAETLLRASVGDEHPFVASAQNNLASVLHAAGRRAEAEQLYRGALEIRRDALAPDHPHIAYALVGLGRLLAEEDRLDEAYEALSEAVEIRTAGFPAGHPELAEAVGLLGRIESSLAAADAASRRDVP